MVDSHQHSWILEEAMSSSLEYNSAEVFLELEEASVKEQSSQLNLEQDSRPENKLEEGSLDSIIIGTFYACFPTLHQNTKNYTSQKGTSRVHTRPQST